MNINKDNYEEYFLLYADKELSGSERKQVELFVSLNPAYEEEFIMLQQAISKPDHSIVMEDKSSLFEAGSALIHAGNQDEYFILYHDNELRPNDKIKTEDYVKRNSLQKDFSIYEQLKTEADTSIVFENKKLLYKNITVRRIPIAAMLAGAALLGFGIWSFTYYKATSTGEKALQAHIASAWKIHHSSPSLVLKDDVSKPVLKTPAVAVTPTITPAKKTDLVLVPNTAKPLLMIKNNSEPAIQGQAPAVDIVKMEQPELQTNDLPKPLHNSRIIGEKDIANVSSPLNTVISAPTNNFAQPASYMLDDRKSDNYVFYNVTEEQFKKSKLGGLLRKVKRVLERKNPLSSYKSTPQLVTN